ncbi:MAG: tyrosine decarboxylase [Candidatus Margulisbacteria bacterium]|nr:tyrosine decarboxylase [Candidatus Margulisiibacteriota bacterium]
MGPKSENQKFFKETLNFMIDEHTHWRRDFHPDDKAAISLHDQYRKDFVETLQRTQEVLLELSSKLRTSSIPWFSPRYLGHMNSDTLMVSNLAYMATLLYNPNNCAYEASPVTTALEIEAGRDLAQMLGYDPEKAWGHITSGGTVANYEAVWVARNLKSIPLAIKEVKPKLVAGLSDWQLLNMPVKKILDLLDHIKAAGLMDQVRDHSVKGMGVNDGQLGKLLVPQSKHLCWIKAADILGIGKNNLVSVQVDDNFRTDLKHLKDTIDRLVKKKVPILGVMSVVGSTEEGAVDKVHEVVKLRDKYEKEGISFYLHVDAAYGGYSRTAFLDEDNKFIPYHRLKTKLTKECGFERKIDWPPREVYNAFKAMSHADSITIDPHKMGYVPYAAGAVVMKDRRILDLITYFAAYIFEGGDNNPMLLGAYILEGSKAGATAASVWAAHRVVPLNITGYGKLIAKGIKGAISFHRSLGAQKPFAVDGRRFIVMPLTKPDFNIVDFAFNEVGNTSLSKMNDLNQKLYEQCSYSSGPVYKDDFITSKTSLDTDSYGNAPLKFVEKLGITKYEWEKTKSVYVLRSCVLTPFLDRHSTYDEYWANFMNTMKSKLDVIIKNGWK